MVRLSDKHRERSRTAAATARATARISKAERFIPIPSSGSACASFSSIEQMNGHPAKFQIDARSRTKPMLAQHGRGGVNSCRLQSCRETDQDKEENRSYDNIGGTVR